MRRELVRNPASSCDAITAVSVEISRPAGGLLALDYTLQGNIAGLAIPTPDTPARTDNLWHHTCPEIFLRQRGRSEYCEFNLSPSTRWAAYHFDRFRDGMKDAPVRTPPLITVTRTPSALAVAATLDLTAMPGLGTDAALELAITTVVEETSGRKSFWALAHAPDKPDFHHPDTFVLELPPP